MEEQLDLIATEKPLHETRLQADSSKMAWYTIAVIRLPGGGYIIRKASGCQGRKEHRETWYRPDYAGAVEKYQQLIRIKTRPRRGRQYKQEVFQWQV